MYHPPYHRIRSHARGTMIGPIALPLPLIRPVPHTGGPLFQRIRFLSIAFVTFLFGRKPNA